VKCACACVCVCVCVYANTVRADCYLGVNESVCVCAPLWGVR
jgi:hypothetical protein